MALRQDENSTCDADTRDGNTPACAEYYPCSMCEGSGRVSDGYEDWTCESCDATGCGFASACKCTEYGLTNSL